MKRMKFFKIIKTGFYFEFPLKKFGILIPSNFVEFSVGIFGIWICNDLLIYLLGSLLGTGLYYANRYPLHQRRFFYPTFGSMKYYYNFLKRNKLNN